MPRTKGKICPLCKKPVQWENNPYWPFCSERCRTIDLGQWAGERYRIPGEKVPEEKGEIPKPHETKDK